MLTAALPRPRPVTVAVECRGCGRTLAVTHDQLREAADADRPVPCAWCDARRLVAPTAPPPAGTRRPPKRTAADLVVLAAAGLLRDRPTVPDVGLADLVLGAWRRAPLTFGLKGCEREHPDSNRVSCEVQKILKPFGVRASWLERVRPGRYRLTPAGAARAKALEGGR